MSTLDGLQELQQQVIFQSEFIHSGEKFVFREMKLSEKDKFKQLFLQIFPKEVGSVAQIDIEMELTQNATDNIQTKIYLLEKDEQMVGFRWIRFRAGDMSSEGFRENNGMAYVPYGGVLEEYRNKRLYPKMMDLTEQTLKHEGVSVITAECEDPDILSSHEEVEADIARRRIGFFTRNGYKFIDAGKMSYTFPNFWDFPDSNVWPDKTNNMFVLGIKLIGALPHAKLQVGLDMKLVGIEKEYLRELYLQQIRLVFMGKGFSDEQLVSFRAVEGYLERLDSHQNAFVGFMQIPLSESDKASDTRTE